MSGASIHSIHSHPANQNHVIRLNRRQRLRLDEGLQAQLPHLLDQNGLSHIRVVGLRVEYVLNGPLVADAPGGLDGLDQQV